MASPTKLLSGVHCLCDIRQMSADKQVTQPEAAEHDKSKLANSGCIGGGPFPHRFFRGEAYPALRRLKALHYSLLLLSVILTMAAGPAPGLILLGVTLAVYCLASSSISAAYVRSQEPQEHEAVQPHGELGVEVQQAVGEAAGAD